MLEDADLAPNKDLKALDTKGLVMMNAALNKIKEQEERISKLEGALGDINTMRKLDLQNLGVWWQWRLKLGSFLYPYYSQTVNWAGEED